VAYFDLENAPSTYINQHLCLLRPNPSKVDGKFLCHLLLSEKYQRRFAFLSDNGAKAGLNLPAISNFSIELPSLVEQRRIAAILDEWDEAIATAERLVNEKRSRKSALVKLLIDDCKRDIAELENICSLTNKKVDLASQHDDRQSIELEDVESETGRLFEQPDRAQKGGIRNAFEPGDTLFAKLRPYLNKFYFAEEGGVASTEMWVLRPIARVCVPRYLYFLVQSRHFKAEANRPSGSRMPRADWDVVRETPLPLPSLKAQNKIVDTLNAAESEVRNSIRLIDQLRLQKRGLMQKLLSGDLPVPVSIDRLMPGGQDIDHAVGSDEQRAEATG
jgi:type I restriction enzyme S subunit